MGLLGVTTLEKLPVSRVDPRRFAVVVVDEIQLSVEILRELPTVRQGDFTVPFPRHISLIKSIQAINEALSRVGYTAMLDSSLRGVTSLARSQWQMAPRQCACSLRNKTTRHNRPKRHRRVN